MCQRAVLALFYFKSAPDFDSGSWENTAVILLACPLLDHSANIVLGAGEKCLQFGHVISALCFILNEITNVQRTRERNVIITHTFSTWNE